MADITPGPALAAAADEFGRRHPETLDPDAIRDLCREYSIAFARDLEDRGDCGGWEVISGLKVAEGWLILAGHWAVQVGGVVVDWTYRQFDPDAPVPRVTTLATWREEWWDVRTVAERCGRWQPTEATA